jgi:hypothetical protein
MGTPGVREPTVMDYSIKYACPYACPFNSMASLSMLSLNRRHSTSRPLLVNLAFFPLQLPSAIHIEWLEAKKK